jgi:RecJ-like exonuclease
MTEETPCPACKGTGHLSLCEYLKLIDLDTAAEQTVSRNTTVKCTQCDGTGKKRESET